MGTETIKKALQALVDTNGDAHGGLALHALSEVKAIEKAAAAVVKWNRDGRPAFDLEAARGYDVLERIADAAHDSITSDGGMPGSTRASLALPLVGE